MNDLDELLRRSLEDAGDRFQPSDYRAAREVFLARNRRRRWIGIAALGGVASAGLAVAALALVLTSAPPRIEQPIAPSGASDMRVVAEIDVGEAPEAVAAVDDAVWVANTGESTISRIDAGSSRVTATVGVEGKPDELTAGLGALWATTTDGDLHRFDPRSGEPLGPPIDIAPAGRLDLALGPDAVWVTAEGSVYRVDPDTEEVQRWASVDVAMDVAVADGVLWALGEWRAQRSTAALAKPNSDDDSSVLVLRGSSGPYRMKGDADLAAGFGSLWASLSDGRVLRVDPQTGEVRDEVALGGTHIDLGVGDSEIWAATIGHDHTSDVGELYRLDPESGQSLGAPLAIDGKPVDVTFGHGAAWVVSNETGTVSRVEVRGEAEPAPNPTQTDETERGEAFAADELLFVFERDRAIHATYGDGSERELVGDARSPVLFPDAQRLMFVRGEVSQAEPGELYTMTLDGEGPVQYAQGELPAVAADGSLAFFDEAAGEIVVDDPSGEVSRRFRPTTDDGAELDVAQIAWQSNARTLYLLTAAREPELYNVDSLGEFATVHFEPEPGGSIYVAIAAVPTRQDAVATVRVCCTEGSETSSAELGVIDCMTECPADFEPVADLSALALGPDATAVRLSFAGRLDADVSDEGSIAWSRGAEDAWFVTYGDEVWLADASGNVTALGALFDGQAWHGATTVNRRD